MWRGTRRNAPYEPGGGVALTYLNEAAAFMITS
jgi:hypothetical protein